MLSATLIQDIVAGHFGLRPAQLLGRSHLPHIARARHIAELLSLEMLPASLKRVGKLFGRHHSTILYARDRLCRRIAVDPEFAKEVARLRTIIRRAAA